VDAASRVHGAVVFAVWHGRFWLPAACFGRWGTTLLVSRSEDGEVIARVAQRLGFRTVRGSSSRGGREGLDALVDAARSGHSVAVTPDGPRGPRHHAQMGAVVVAARSGCPVIPVGAASRPAWTFRSWDAFQVPLLGARGAVVFAEPYPVPPETDLEPWRVGLEGRLHAAQAQAEYAVGARGREA